MAGRRYSAGRIFLDVIPSFKGVVRETEREVEKLRKKVAADNKKAAEDDEKGQARARTKERVKGEREANKAVEDARDDHWKKLSIAERRAWAREERLRRLREKRANRDERERLIAADAAAAKRLAQRYAAEEKSRVAHERQLAKIQQNIAVKAGQDMWKKVQADAAQAQKERLQMAREAEEAEEALVRQRLAYEKQVAKEELRVHREKLAEKRRADREAHKTWENMLQAELKETARAAKMQGGRFGQEMRKGLNEALKDLDEVKLEVDADTDPVTRKLATLRKDLMSLRDKKIGVDIDGKGALAELKVLKRQADSLDRRGYDIRVRTNAKGVSAILREQISTMRAAGRAAADLGNRHNRSRDSARDAANAFRLFRFMILGVALAIPMLVPLIASLVGLLGLLGPLAIGAGAGLGALIFGFSGLGDAVSALGDQQQNAAKDALAYEKTMRNAARGVRDAQQGVNDAARDAARAQADSARAVSDAQQGVKDALREAAQAAQDSARRVRDARRGVVDAERAAAEAAETSADRVRDARRQLVDATESGAERVQDALRRVRDAEKDLTRAQEDSADAQRDLQRARQEAADQLRDMQLRAAGGALAERQARLDLRKAYVAYEEAMADPTNSSWAKEEASIGYERAQLDLKRTIQDNRDLAKEIADAQKAGIEGSERVMDAKERLADANERQRDSEVALRDAERDVAKARVEAAGRVAEAQEAVADAIKDQARQQEDSARAVADANERLSDAIAAQARQQEDSARTVARARRDAADALVDQQRQQEDSARAQRDAAERLMDAQAAYQEALTKTGDIGSSSMQKLQEAMDNLSPAAQRFAYYLHGLRDEWQRLKFSLQEGMMPGMQEAVGTLMRPEFMPAYEDFLFRMGQSLGEMAHKATHALIGPQWAPFFEMLDTLGIPMMEQVATVFGNVALVLANLATAFAPFSVTFGDALIRITEGWVAWSAGLIDSPGFYRFMDYVSRVGPMVSGFFVDLGKALINLGIGLAPYGEMLLTWFAGFFRWIAEADPKLVGAIAAGIIGIVIAIQLASGALALFSGASMFFSKNAAGGFANPIGLIMLALTGLVTVLAIARASSDEFRAATDWLMEKIVEIVSWIWEYRDAWGPALAVMVVAATSIYGIYKALGYVQVGLAGVRAGMALFGIASTATIGWIVAIVAVAALLVLGLIKLWRENDTFREKMLSAWERVKSAVAFVVEWFQTDAIPSLIRAWEWLVDVLQAAWRNVGKPVFDELMKLGTWMARMFLDYVAPTIGHAFNILWGIVELVLGFVMRELRATWDNTEELRDKGGKALASLGEFFLSLWTDGVRPALEGIGDIIEWTWKHIIEPTFRKISEAVDVMVKAFESGEGLIGTIWAGIVAAIGDPINFVIGWTNDTLVGGLNDILQKVGLEWRIPEIPEVSTPHYISADRGLRSGTGKRSGTGTTYGRAATGGVLPGYSPGIDNIRFTSPVGDLLLSGGEGILRPEVVKALSPSAIDDLNSAAISGGEQGVRKILGAHARGTSAIDFDGLPRIPRTDIAKPPSGGLGKKFWDAITTAGKAVMNPRKAVSTLIDALGKYRPLKDTFAGEYLWGWVKKLGSLVGGKADEFGGQNNSTVNYGGRLGWNPNVPTGSWPSTWAAIRTVAPEARMTSNYRPGAITASGVPSLHGQGRAVDIVSPNMAETFRKIRNLRRWSQLFYTPMGNLQIGYRDAIVARTHWDHIHAGYNRGGVFDRSDFDTAAPADLGLYDTGGILNHGDLGINLSGKPEAVLTNDQWAALDRASRALHAADVMPGDGPMEIGDDTIDKFMDRFGSMSKENRRALVRDLVNQEKAR